MKTFHVNWIRTYYKSGTFEIEANNEVEAHAKVNSEMIGDEAAKTSLDFDPSNDEIDIEEEP